MRCHPAGTAPDISDRANVGLLYHLGEASEQRAIQGPVGQLVADPLRVGAGHRVV